MNQTLIGYFENESGATRARQELLQAGFTESHMRIQAGSSTDSMSSTSSTTAMSGQSTTSGESHSGIGGFFRSLFGMDDNDEQVSTYSEGLRRGGYLLSVDVENDTQLDRAEQILQQCGAVDIDERAQQWRQEGWSGAAAAGGTAALTGGTAMVSDTRVDISSGDASTTIPVVQEELQVGKRAVRRGGLRVFTRVVETPVQETVRLREEQATIERRPVDRPATEADLAGMQQGAIEVRETGEEAVVAKQARVVEEIEVGKQVTEREQVVSDTVRHTDVQVEQLGADTTKTAGTTGTAGTTSSAGTMGSTGKTGKPM